MDYTYLKHIITGFFSILLVTGYAQTGEKQENEKHLNTEQTTERESSVMDFIDVVRDYRPMLADAVKIRRNPDLDIDRGTLELELRSATASMYFSLNNYKQPYHSPLSQKFPNALRENIDNNRIGVLAYTAGEYERAASILEKVEPLDAFYQSSLIALGNIALKNNDKKAAANSFYKASILDYDEDLKADGLYNYAKVLYELDSISESMKSLQDYFTLKREDFVRDSQNKENTETLMSSVFGSTTNFQAAVHLLESFNKRDQEADIVYQKATFYRGIEFYNERAFENSISMFMRSEKFTFDKEMAALATYWKAEAMYEVRKYAEAVENFTKFLQLPAARNTPVYNYANYALAYAAFRNNRFNLAAQNFERFLASAESASDENIRFDVLARLGIPIWQHEITIGQSSFMIC